MNKNLRELKYDALTKYEFNEMYHNFLILILHIN